MDTTAILTKQEITVPPSPEHIKQCIADGVHPITGEKLVPPVIKAENILLYLLECAQGDSIDPWKEIEWLEDYIGLLQRQANKAKNQREVLKSLNKSYRFIKQELEMLRLLDDQVLRASVNILQQKGFAVLNPKVQEALKLKHGMVPRIRSSDEVPVPCGKIQRNKQHCVDGQLCDHCAHIVNLEHSLRNQ